MFTRKTALVWLVVLAMLTALLPAAFIANASVTDFGDGVISGAEVIPAVQDHSKYDAGWDVAVKAGYFKLSQIRNMTISDVTSFNEPGFPSLYLEDFGYCNDYDGSNGPLWILPFNMLFAENGTFMTGTGRLENNIVVTLELNLPATADINRIDFFWIGTDGVWCQSNGAKRLVDEEDSTISFGCNRNGEFFVIYLGDPADMIPGPVTTPSPEPTAEPTTEPTVGPEFPRGDVNLDGEVDIDDILAVRGHMFGTAMLEGDYLAKAEELCTDTPPVIDIDVILAIRGIIFG